MIPQIHTIRALLFFSDGRFEWSESWFQPPGASLDDTMLKVTNGLLPFRLQLTAKGVQLTEIRVSDDAVFRDSDVNEDYQQWATFPGASKSKQVYNPALCTAPDDCTPEVPNICLKLRMDGHSAAIPEHTHRRILYMAGNPEQVTVDQGNAVPPFGSKEWGVRFLAFLNYVQANADGWVFPVTIKDVTATFMITNIVRAGGNTGPITVTTAAVPTFNIGDTVGIYFPHFQEQSLRINGRYEVFNVGPGNTFQVQEKRFGTVAYASGGQAARIVRDYVTIDKARADGWSDHDRGFAELAVRGRSRPRRNYQP